MPTPPPMPAEPPTVHSPQAADTTADDWWDRLYADEEQAPAEDPAPRRIAVPADRLPDWWADKPIHLGEEVDEEEPEEDTDADEVDDEPDEVDEEEDTDEDSVPVPSPKAPAADSLWRGWAPAGAVGMRILHPVRGRKVLYNASAAAFGWGLDASQPLENLISACGREYGQTAAVVLGSAVLVAIGVLIDHKTRHWWPPLAWMCRIPLATAVLALALASF